VEHDPPPNVFDIGHVERDQLGAPQSSGEADQEQGSVSDVLQPVTHGVEHQQQIIPQQGLGFALSKSPCALDAAQGRPH
jgi:hypothetical protein